MNIGVDLDGVLFDTENYFRVEALLYDIEKSGDGEKRREESFFQKRFDWSKEQEDDFLVNCFKNVEKSAPIMPRADFVIRKLKEMGHKLYVITNRGSYFKEEIDITKERLDSAEIEFDGYYFCSSDKAKICKELNIDLLIDDLYDNVVKVTGEGIKCLYYRDLVLKLFDHKLCHEVRNWADIYYEIIHFSEWN